MTIPKTNEKGIMGGSVKKTGAMNTAKALRTPKAIVLLKLLDDNEFLSLKEQLVKIKKLRLLILAEHCRATEIDEYTHTTKVALFEQVFSEPYVEKKDYLLRNEFRHLSHQIETFLVQDEVSKELAQDHSVFGYYLLLALQDRKAQNLFKLEYQDIYETALSHSDYHSAHSISRLNFVNFAQYLDIKEKDASMLDRLNDLRLTHLSCYYLASYRTIQVDKEYARSSLHPFSLIEDPPPKEVRVDFADYENDYSVYLYLKAQTYIVNDQEKLRLLEQCLTYVISQPTESDLFQEELKFCLSGLANTHALMQSFDRAQEFFRQYFELKFEHDDPQRLSVLCDQIATLVRSRSFEKALVIIDANRKELTSIDKHRTRVLSLEIATKAILRDTNGLNALLPINFKGYGGRSKAFFKFYFSIHSYLNGEIEAAHNEVLNMKSTSIMKEESELRSILKFFIRLYYINLHVSDDVVKKRTLLIKLKLDIREYREGLLPSVKSYLPFLWLTDELNFVCLES